MTLSRLQKLVLAALICSFSVINAGCKSGGIKPDLSSIAFWKKDNVQLASRNVPPPSAHFSPDRGSSSKSIANANANEQQLKSSVDAIIAEAKRNKALPKDPVRKPYSLDSIESKIGEAKKATNDFVGDPSLQTLQQSASTAFQGSANKISQAGKLAQNPADAMKGLAGGIQKQGNHAASQIASGMSEGLARQANNVVSGSGGMIDSATNGIKQMANEVQEATDNSFQPRAVEGPQLERNPYLGALNNVNEKVLTAAASTNPAVTQGLAQKVSSAKENLAQAVNNVSVPASGSANKNNLPTTTEIQQSSFNSSLQNVSNALKPLDNAAAGQAGKIVVPAQPPISSYPSTPFGAIKPVQAQPASSLPNALLNGKTHFAPGSTKPLQPLR